MSDIVERLRAPISARFEIGVSPIAALAEQANIERSQAADLITRLRAENETLRQIVSDSASALGNGAHIAPQCSIEFMQGLPKEIRLHVSGLRAEAFERAAQIAESHPWGCKPIADAIRAEASKGFFANLTPEQQERALAHRGEENHGDPAFANRKASGEE